MDDTLTSRWSAVIGILAAVAVLQSGRLSANSQVGGAGSPNAEASSVGSDREDDLRWGSDGTRDSLSDKLDAFFGSQTGNFNVVLPEAKNKLQPNGEYLLADQVRLALYGVASSKVVEPDGSVIYEAFVNQNPYVDTFIKTNAEGDIEGVALTGDQDILKEGHVVGIVPKITFFSRQASTPVDLKARAEKIMKDFWSRTGPELAYLANEIKIVEQRIP